jgi:filamentous hemagglutinin family protein
LIKSQKPNPIKWLLIFDFQPPMTPTLLNTAIRHGGRFWPAAAWLGLWLIAGRLEGGDILRGGAAAPVRQTDASAGAALAAQQQARASQQDALVRTAQSLQAVRAMQAQARAASLRRSPVNAGTDPNHPGQTLPNVPEGMGVGGLQLNRPATGALAPVQQQLGAQTRITIKQTQQQALLDWDSFNIGRNTHLLFDQSAGGVEVDRWIAFNRVNDPSGRPSQLLGQISAPGQVYIINQNGIIFGGASQINVRSLVASSLPINDNLIQRGLLNNPDSQFLFSALPIPAGSKGTPAFIPPPSNLPDNRHGDVTVQPGAVITSSVSADGNGGRLMLVGPNVTNAGSMVTPNGQVILAAGLQVGVDAHRSSDASLRGLDVYVGTVGAAGGIATNDGLIEILRGSASLSGKAVKQNAAIESSTTVSLNGRIDLAANYDAVANTGYDPAIPTTGTPFLFQSTGAVTLGPGSVTRIVPEWGSVEKSIGTELALRSQVNLQGKTILLQNEAKIFAPNALVSLKAGTWAYNTSTTPPTSTFLAFGGQVYLEQGAAIDVSGSTGVTAPLSQVILSLMLRGGELAPSPLQRDGVLRGPTLTVDLRNRGMYNGRAWIGTPLADLTGYEGLIERTVGELTVTGGGVEVSAGGSVVLQPSSSINVSGGHIEYLGDTVKTSRIWADGHLVDIKNATPDRVYGGIYSGTWNEVHARWGMTQTYAQALALTGEHYEQTYLHGADAGRLSLAAPSMALDGRLTGLVSPGPRQFRTSSHISELPQAAELSLAFSGQEALNNAVVTTFPAPPSIIFDHASQRPAGPFDVDTTGTPAPLAEYRQRTVILSPELTGNNGFGSVVVHNDGGNITVPSHVRLLAPSGGGFKFFGSNINIFGQTVAPGGTLAFEALNLTSYERDLILAIGQSNPGYELPPPNTGRGEFTLGSGAVLSTAGVLVDDRLGADAPFSLPAALAGGALSIKGYTTDLAPGSRIDVSGGALIDPRSERFYGNAGSIVLQGGQDPHLNGVIGGRFALGSTLAGYSGAVGGSLAIQAPLIRIGGQGASVGSLRLRPDFFNEGGFSQFSLTGLPVKAASGTTLPALIIATGTRLEPTTRSLVAVPNPPGGGLALRIIEKPVGVRPPVSLSFTAAGIRDGILDVPLLRGDLIMGERSLIRTDPMAAVSLTGRTLTVLGSIEAPGGVITLAAGDSNAARPNTEIALTTLFLGPRSALTTTGTTLLLPDAYGRRTGRVLPGGTISLTGNILAAPGSLLDVSGTSGLLDLHPSVARPLLTYVVPATSGLTAALYNLDTEPTRVDSAGGVVNLTGLDFLVSDATQRGRAGGPTATGGELNVSSGRFYPPGNLPQPTDVTLTVRQHGSIIPSDTLLTAGAISQPMPGAISGGLFAADSFARGGFDSLSLGGSVSFEGPISLHGRGFLRIATEGILTANDVVQLTAPSVALGRDFETPQRPEDRRSPFGVGVAPTYGPGRLVVTANHIDVGTLSLQNIGSATLSAIRGDLRGNGVVNIAGDLSLRAGQIYPVTASPFEVFAYDYSVNGEAQPGSITIESSGTRSLPLSAGGSLALYASRISHDGVLRAPFGSITLGWDGTGTAPIDLLAGSAATVPVTRQLTLGPGSVTSVSAIDPRTGRGVLIPYGISPDGLTWIDPRGVDITAGGLPEKAVTIAAQQLTTAAGAKIDLRGGGDLFAYRWIDGNGGPEDILASNGSYAILPGFASHFAPVAAYNTSNAATNLIAGSDPGYVNPQLNFGDRVYLQASETLPAGYYTLLPARYALLPGGVLVTPQTRRPTGTWELPDGSSLVSGYQFNSLNQDRTAPTLATQFELASGTVIRQRAEYETYRADGFLDQAAERLNLGVTRLPRDSGRLLIRATQSLHLSGNVLSPSLTGGRGSRIDISAPLDFLINRTGAADQLGVIALSAPTLQRWNAESLLIGGNRTTDAQGRTQLNVLSGRITVDNAGLPLTAADLTLAATDSIVLAPGAEISVSGVSAAEDYHVRGNGVLVRVAADPQAQVIRTGVSPSASIASLRVDSGARLSGGSIILDSTNATTIDPTSRLNANAYALNSGRISLVLDGPGILDAEPGLILAGSALANLQSGSTLALRSYSSLDLYGSGLIGGGLDRLVLNAGEIRGASGVGQSVSFSAREIQLGNSAGVTSTLQPPGTAGQGTASFEADILRLTAGDLAINSFSSVSFRAAQAVVGESTGRLAAQNDLALTTPLITGAAGSRRLLLAGGSLTADSSSDQPSPIAPGLGATLSLSGRQTTISSDILLPSGSLAVRSADGPLRINGRLNVAGQPRSVFDVTRYADAGTIVLAAAAGDVILGPSSFITVAADTSGGNAGSLTVAAPQGSFLIGGSLVGTGGAGGRNASFALDALSLPSTSALSQALSRAGLTNDQTIRLRNGDVMIDGTATARTFRLSADQGAIAVRGTIDASGSTGGTIHLAARSDLSLENGSRLTVAAQQFDSAGKGGQITLEAGTQSGGVAGTGILNLQTGSVIDLSVSASSSSSAAQGQFTGKLHLRAPQNLAGTDVLAAEIGSTIIDPSSIVIEGYRLYDLTESGGAITTAVQSAIKNDGVSFLGAAGTGHANESAITNRLLASNPGLSSVAVLLPGAEIINRTGNLTLGTAGTTTLDDWDLSTNRFGSKSAAGVLTLRAAGDLVFFNTLSDGFNPFTPVNNPPAANLQLWLGRLTPHNSLLPANTQSYSYRLTAGADLTASNFSSVQSVGGETGSLILGKAGTTTDEQNNTVSGGDNALTRSVIPQRWQVIRTGSGDITLSAAKDIQLLNQFATIYSAGTAVADPSLGGSFDVPRPGQQPTGTSGLGAAQVTPLYPAQYAMAGGNVTLNARGNIEHLTRNAAGQLFPDSQLQLPSNWLYRRGTVDPATGRFAPGRVANDVLSTSWWVDYSNFFQGIGALGGGHVSLIAGGSVSNVDAAVPTNLRVSKGSESNPLAANQSGLELGGGDLIVRAGANIDAGVYYVERGSGTLTAGGSIITNETRSVLSPSSIAAGQGSSYTQLPTTLFAGRAGFQVSARGDVLLGPVGTPFLLPGGLGNSVWYKSFFSTYDSQSAVTASSLGGSVTLRSAATPFLQSAGAADPLLFLWAANKLMLGSDTASRAKPWLRLNESGIDEIIRYKTVAALQPGTLHAIAYSGDINLAGNLTLTPSPTGTLSLLAAAAINALQPNGLVNLNGLRTSWGVSTVNVSDANPLDLPSILSPLGYTTAQAQAVSTKLPLFFSGVDALFAETGSTTGVLQTKQALHAPGPLHRDNPQPLRLYAASGDISGLTLFAPTSARVFAARDLTDLALYIQNVRPDDVSIVTSGRDIIPANANSPLRVEANRGVNIPNFTAGSLAGDIQISGPGSLQVLAGRTLDLGTVAGNPDGTGVGLTSIGNARNPNLAFAGAHIIAGAGIGSSTGLGVSSLDFDSFIAEYVEGGRGPEYLTELAAEMNGRSFDELVGEERDRIALEVFYRVLRDAGRSQSENGGGGGYADGFAAIESLFPVAGSGDILTRGRDIRTRNGGNISLFTPGGSLALARTTIGNPLAPPGIVTESGGNISIFTDADVSVGIGRIFTLRGGNQIIWSSNGDIAAGSSSKTVTSAPPTRVLIDPQSGAVQTDLAGLATGGGIGVLATVAGVEPGDVNLIAPTGVVDAGDAGIRSSGNLTIAATQVLNAGNIAVSGTSSGTPTTVVSTPNVAGLSAASSTAGAASAAGAATAAANASSAQPQTRLTQALPSIYTVEVLGYGGSEAPPDEDEETRRRRMRETR